MSDVKNETLYDGPILEEPDSKERPEAGVGTLFPEDLPVIASKLTAMESFFRLLVSNLNFQDFIREVLVTFLRAVKCEAGSILEVNHEEKTIFFRAAAGHASDQVVSFVIPMGQGIVGHVVESRQPLLVANVGENQVHLKAISNAIGFEARNLIALPLVVRGQVYGVLELLNRVGEPDFTEADQDLLNSLAQLASRAIEIRLMISWGLRNRDENKSAA